MCVCVQFTTAIFSNSLLYRLLCHTLPLHTPSPAHSIQKVSLAEQPPLAAQVPFVEAFEPPVGGMLGVGTRQPSELGAGRPGEQGDLQEVATVALEPEDQVAAVALGLVQPVVGVSAAAWGLVPGQEALLRGCMTEGAGLWVPGGTSGVGRTAH